MSTRSNIFFEIDQYYNEDNPNNGFKQSQYYKHHDGYEMGVGLDLVRHMLKLIESNDPDDMSSIYSIDSWVRFNMPAAYEHEKEINPHGDIEYLYIVNFDNGITITRYKRGDFENKVDDWKEWQSKVIFKATTGTFGREKYYDLKLIDLEDK